MNDDNNVPSRGAILLANARGAPKPRLHWSNVLQYGEALKEAAINAKPELDSDTRTDRGSAVDELAVHLKWCYKLAEQWQPNFEMFETPDRYDPSPV
jgi:hypothetical protein